MAASRTARCTGLLLLAAASALAADVASENVECSHDGPGRICRARSATKVQRDHLLFQSNYGLNLSNSTGQLASVQNCCSACGAFCSPRSGHCHDWKAKSHYIKCTVSKVEPKSPRLIWEGWGVSLAWWANAMGHSDILADLCFTLKEDVMVAGQRVVGLGMTIVRYNLGASSWNTVDGRHRMQISPNVPHFKKIEGFWQDWYSDDPSSASWNWEADANQVSMLYKAKLRGVEYMELFSNAPMWWMVKNHNPAGAWDDNCLTPHNHEAFAKYLAITAKHFLDKGIRFTTVEPFNEPVSGFWWHLGTQEGCGFDANLQAWILGLLRRELNRQGLDNLTIAASDENKNREAIETWKTFATARTPDDTPGGARALVGQINVHAYGVDMRGTSWHRDALRQEVGADRKIWMSEYGEEEGTGWLLATNVNLDFRWLRPSAWCIWQFLDETGGWGLIRAELRGRPHIQEVNTKYWVFAHYSRHIRPGMSILPCGNDWCVSAYDQYARRLVLVQQSDEHMATTFTYNLSSFARVSGPVTRWVTSIEGDERYAKDDLLRVADRSVVAHTKPLTIHTIEIENVELELEDAEHELR